jgi:hypothetical protein
LKITVPGTDRYCSLGRRHNDASQLFPGAFGV